MEQEFQRNLLQGINLEESQEKRRRLLLKQQKIQRAEAQDLSRVFEYVIAEFEEFKEKSKTSKSSKRTYKQKYGIKYRLQEAEWLKERPEDFSDWIIVPYPKGTRCIVIACDGKTEVYSKKGHLITVFKSYLPGGGLHVYNTNKLTILDCVQIEKNLKYQVLDAFVCGAQEFQNCETSLRFFWTKSRIDEWRENDYFDSKFEPPVYFDMDNSLEVACCFQKYPFWEDMKLDGYLFYHKESSYTFGRTPLVGWLFPFMVEELLGFEVSPSYLKPDNYEDAFSYMKEFDQDMLVKKKAKRRRNKLDVEMKECGEAFEENMEEEIDNEISFEDID